MEPHVDRRSSPTTALAVSADRVTSILARLSSTGSPGHASTGRLCAVAAEVTEMSGAGIMLMVGNEPHTSICTTGAVSTLLEELQYTLGEGPCVDAYRLGDLSSSRTSGCRRRSLAGVHRPAVAGGARAVFGFPMSVGSFGSARSTCTAIARVR